MEKISLTREFAFDYPSRLSARARHCLANSGIGNFRNLCMMSKIAVMNGTRHLGEITINEIEAYMNNGGLRFSMTSEELDDYAITPAEEIEEVVVEEQTVPTTPPIVKLYELAKEMVDTAIIVPPTAEYPNDIPEEVFTRISGTLNFLLPYYRARRG